jgi:hypothetical protein
MDTVHILISTKQEPQKRAGRSVLEEQKEEEEENLCAVN